VHANFDRCFTLSERQNRRRKNRRRADGRTRLDDGSPARLPKGRSHLDPPSHIACADYENEKGDGVRAERLIALDMTLSPPKLMLMCGYNRAQGQREFRHALFIDARKIDGRLWNFR
jgi:hypothetical protein